MHGQQNFKLREESKTYLILMRFNLKAMKSLFRC